MAFIRTIPLEEATGAVKEIYDEELKAQGYVANGTLIFSLRPEAFGAMEHLRKTIRGKIRLRRYELVTIAAARALHCTYCLLAHGSVLRKNFFDAEQLEMIINDYHNAGLTPQEVGVMEFAEKVTLHGHAVDAEDVEKLRAHDLKDEEILDIVLAASLRNFISRVTDSLGVDPDLQFLELEPNVRKAMQKGRPFAEAEICPHCFGTHIVKKIRTEDGREEYYCPYCHTGGLVKPKNRYSEAQKSQILEHYERYSPQGIQQTFGVSPATLARWEKEKAARARAKKK